MSRPLIGVTTSARFTPAWPFLALSVWIAGGRAQRITPKMQRVDLDALDGLIIGGGDDIGAELYGGAAMLNARVDPLRDELELSLLDRFWRAATPIMGVCRGAQIMNVFRGGTLHGDIHAVYVDAPKMRTVLPKKRVRIEPDTDLGRLSGVDEIVVNSLHHQSVDRLGEGLRVAATDASGIVQSVEETGPRYRLGVQWHPEFLFYRGPHRRLFRGLVSAAKAPAARMISETSTS
ncbi:MAG: gamma-glutamyl-gamma-aminobutyrate hydrolase family protein [Pseudomonadota bacterium]